MMESRIYAGFRSSIPQHQFPYGSRDYAYTHTLTSTEFLNLSLYRPKHQRLSPRRPCTRNYAPI